MTLTRSGTAAQIRCADLHMCFVSSDQRGCLLGLQVSMSTRVADMTLSSIVKANSELRDLAKEGLDFAEFTEVGDRFSGFVLSQMIWPSTSGNITACVRGGRVGDSCSSRMRSSWRRGRPRSCSRRPTWTALGRWTQGRPNY